MLFNMLFTIIFSLLFTTTLAMPLTGPEAQLMVDTHPPPTVPGGTTTCPKQKFCGRVYFARSTVEFDQAMCMELKGDWKSIWIANCQCTFWSSCTPRKSIWVSAPRDIFLSSMAKCALEKKVSQFPIKPKYMSCSYKNTF
ncbi:hypothetical protein NX059_001350 [Plenodomus lindquistii]|nr:hypothetical protein NX059_001350 [Plenodomus lindquistii]